MPFRSIALCLRPGIVLHRMRLPRPGSCNDLAVPLAARAGSRAGGRRGRAMLVAMPPSGQEHPWFRVDAGWRSPS